MLLYIISLFTLRVVLLFSVVGFVVFSDSGKEENGQCQITKGSYFKRNICNYIFPSLGL